MTDRFISDGDYATFEAAILENDVPIVGDDLDYGRWFVCDQEAAPTRRVRRPRADPFATFKQSLREIVREELRKASDRKSFAAASGMMSLSELGEFIGRPRNTIYDCRRRRALAKSKALADAEFPPEYGKGRRPQWKRTEVEAWLESQKRG